MSSSGQRQIGPVLLTRVCLHFMKSHVWLLTNLFIGQQVAADAILVDSYSLHTFLHSKMTVGHLFNFFCDPWPIRLIAQLTFDPSDPRLLHHKFRRHRNVVPAYIRHSADVVDFSLAMVRPTVTRTKLRGAWGWAQLTLNLLCAPEKSNNLRYLL